MKRPVAKFLYYLQILSSSHFFMAAASCRFTPSCSNYGIEALQSMVSLEAVG